MIDVSDNATREWCYDTPVPDSNQTRKREPVKVGSSGKTLKLDHIFVQHIVIQI